MSKPIPTVLHLASYGAPYSGNFITSLKALETTLQKASIRQIVGFSDVAKDREWFKEWQQARPSTFLLPHQASPYEIGKKLVKITNAENVRIIHTHFIRYEIAAWTAKVLLGKASNVQLVWHQHSSLGGRRSYFQRTKDLVKLRLMGKRVRIVAVSEGAANDMLLRGATPDQISIILNAIDVQRATQQTSSRQVLRQMLGVSNDSKLLLLFGWAPHRKGVDIAVQAAERLIKDGFDIVLILIGEAQLQDFLEATVGRTLPSWLRVKPPCENVADLYAVADIFVAPSRSEGLPYAVCEAMVNCLPAALSDIPSHKPLINSPNAVRFENENPRDLANALKSILSRDEREREKCGEEGKSYIEENFSMDAWCRNMLEFYQAVLAGEK